MAWQPSDGEQPASPTPPHDAPGNQLPPPGWQPPPQPFPAPQPQQPPPGWGQPQPGWGQPPPAWGPPQPGAGPVPPTWGGPGWPPGQLPPVPPAPKRRRGLIVGLSIVTVLVLVGAAAVFLATRSPYPSRWDERVQPYVTFVEGERGLAFEHPVAVEFIPADEFDAMMTDSSGTTDEDRAAYEEAAAMLRAVGLHEGPLDLEEETNQLYEAGVLAYYSPEDERVRVKGDAITPEVQVTLVHELTHALQDQHFDLSRLDDFPTTTQQEAFRTIVEGDASWVEDAYLASLPDDEREEIEAAEDAGAEQAADEVEGLNDVLVATFSAPYLMGPPMLELLHAEDGYEAVNEAIRHPPADEAAIFDPRDLLSERARPELAPPTLPDDAEPVPDEEQAPPDSMGAVSFFMMLAARLDPHEAMIATDLVASDTMVTYQQGGRTCVALDVATADGDDADELAISLDAWAEAMPPEADASVTQVGTTLEVRTCDPGEGVAQHIVGSPADALTLPAVRLYTFAGALGSGLSEERADCIADTFVDGITVEQIVDEDADPADFDDLRVEAMAACRG